MLEELERLIDSSSVSKVLGLIATICDEKAKRIEVYWQDQELALEWRKAAKHLLKLSLRLTV